MILLAAALAAGCTTTKAQTRVDMPALEVPAPPARTIEPVPAETAAPEPVNDLPSAPATPPRSRPQRDTNANRGEAKPPTETKPPETPPAAVDPGPPVTVPPAPQLRTPEESDPAQSERQIRDIVGRANGLLSKVDYRKLNGDRQKAYNEAKMFNQQAEEAIKTGNLVFARNLAEKAERLAKELQGR
jgi:hypothetical protein